MKKFKSIIIIIIFSFLVINKQAFAASQTQYDGKYEGEYGQIVIDQGKISYTREFYVNEDHYRSYTFENDDLSLNLEECDISVIIEKQDPLYRQLQQMNKSFFAEEIEFDESEDDMIIARYNYENIENLTQKIRRSYFSKATKDKYKEFLNSFYNLKNYRFPELEFEIKDDKIQVFQKIAVNGYAYDLIGEYVKVE